MAPLRCWRVVCGCGSPVAPRGDLCWNGSERDAGTGGARVRGGWHPGIVRRGPLFRDLGARTLFPRCLLRAAGAPSVSAKQGVAGDAATLRPPLDRDGTEPSRTGGCREPRLID
ncbi:hypothetical protein HPB47_012376 [Ixodes persulcatus]|uniref:Uncharacterized protein n=1 Tax=Ixodes persulcatus TaxID=34615 RepID=A0AC60NTS8_IXOPE|nr:hypothetical protein HPB47_012376 [Ixodes persulcatus]